jgi:hypothetical protein
MINEPIDLALDLLVNPIRGGRIVSRDKGELGKSRICSWLQPANSQSCLPGGCGAPRRAMLGAKLLDLCIREPLSTRVICLFDRSLDFRTKPSFEIGLF